MASGRRSVEPNRRQQDHRPLGEPGRTGAGDRGGASDEEKRLRLGCFAGNMEGRDMVPIGYRKIGPSVFGVSWLKYPTLPIFKASRQGSADRVLVEIF